ncbi:hypothetical protein PV325_007428 [Microctonus aethiopoides]|nr:hypothetical protein PV325_007428 [Microctonus aethiopoides]KAK0082041.1 hypothetical protein PV326_007369 [Microctonus aethiopoides]
MTPSNSYSAENSACTKVEDNFDFDNNTLDKCVLWVKARGFEKICLQFPDTCLPYSANIAMKFNEHLENKVFILGDTTCGSCCVDEIAANHINADAIIHFGHACLNPTARLPVFHVLPKKQFNIENFVSQFKSFFHNVYEKIILFYDVSHAHVIEKIWKLLAPEYKELVMSKLNSKSNVEFVDTQNEDGKNILICGRTWTLDNGGKLDDYQAVYIGENDKTLVTLTMSIPTKSWHYIFNNAMEYFEVMDNPWLKKRRYLVEKLKDARTVGIVVATLGIKDYLEALSTIKSILKKKNKKSYIFSIGKPNPTKLANFSEIDVFVVIACPENEIFDSRDYFKPILTPFEVELAFNNSRTFSTNYCLDFRQILPSGENYVEFTTKNNADVSLISGDIRNDEVNQVISDKMNVLSCKNEGTVAVGKAGANYLLERSWQGLKQCLGESEIKHAEKGRCGLPINYDSEPLSNSS